MLELQAYIDTIIDYIEETLKEKQIRFSVVGGGSSILYSLKIGSFPVYIQYDVPTLSNKYETLQGFIRNEDDEDEEFFNIEIDGDDLSIIKDEIEEFINELIEQSTFYVTLYSTVENKLNEIKALIDKHDLDDSFVLNLVNKIF